MTQSTDTNGFVVFWECAVLLVIAFGICYLIVRLKVWRDNAKNRKLQNRDKIMDYLDHNKRKN